MEFATQSDPNDVPSKVRITFRIGVTGHRHLTLSQAETVKRFVCEIISKALEAATTVLSKKYTALSSESPVVSVVTALAAGADQVAANAALQLKRTGQSVNLHSVLPFALPEYELDFHAASTQSTSNTNNVLDGVSEGVGVRAIDDLVSTTGPEQLKVLVTNSDRVMTLEGVRETRKDRFLAYEAAGRVVLEQSDCLIAVLDPHSHEKQGGSIQIAREARQLGLPVIEINPTDLSAPQIQLSDGHKVVDTWQEQFLTIVENMLSPPHTEGLSESERGRLTLLEDFFAEKPIRKTRMTMLPYRLPWLAILIPSIAWRDKWFRGFLSVISIFPRIRETRNQRAVSAFDMPYSVSHSLAVKYAILYRGSFAYNYFLGATAVTCALLSYADIDRHTLWTIVELIAIALAIANFLTQRKFRWRERLLDYRFLAEQLRQLRVLHPLGLSPAAPRQLLPGAGGDPSNTWMNWLVRANCRAGGLFTGNVTRDNWHSTLNDQWVQKQLTYHRKRALELKAIKHMLHSLSIICFGLAALACLGHLFNYSDVWTPWLTLAAAALPAWSAAFHAIGVQGEFERLVERSQEIIARLELIGRELNAVMAEANNFANLHSITKEVAQIMIDDVTDWRIMYRGPKMQMA